MFPLLLSVFRKRFSRRGMGVFASIPDSSVALTQPNMDMTSVCSQKSD